ncbi:hypothetical protein L345_17877, partial [Ophiophagus hannah]
MEKKDKIFGKISLCFPAIRSAGLSSALGEGHHVLAKQPAQMKGNIPIFRLASQARGRKGKGMEWERKGGKGRKKKRRERKGRKEEEREERKRKGRKKEGREGRRKEGKGKGRDRERKGAEKGRTG